MNMILNHIIIIVGFLSAFNLILYTCSLHVPGSELFAQQRITISMERANALSLTTAEGNQVKVIINYNMHDESLIGQRINAIMAIYNRENSSLIKLSSFPNGFIINNTEGTTKLATTLTDNTIKNITTIVTLTNAEKSEKYSNDVRADLNLRTILPTLCLHYRAIFYYVQKSLLVKTKKPYNAN